MAQTPYEILGVSENATADEIKKAYRRKARENHPDLHPNDPSAEARMKEINEAYDRLSNPDKYAAEDARKNAARGYSAGQSSTGNPYGQGGYSYGGSQNQGGYSSYYYDGTGSSQRTGGSGQTGWSGDFGFDWFDFFGAADAQDAGSIHPEAQASDSAEMRAAINYINAGQHRNAIGILNAIPSTGRNARWYYLIALANYGAGNTMLAMDQIRRAVQMDPNNSAYQRAMNGMKRPAQTYEQEAQSYGFQGSSMNTAWACCGCLALQSICMPSMMFMPCYC